MTVAWIRHEPSASLLRYAYIREGVTDMLLLPADDEHTILSHRNNADNAVVENRGDELRAP